MSTPRLSPNMMAYFLLSGAIAIDSLSFSREARFIREDDVSMGLLRNLDEDKMYLLPT